MTTPSQMPSSIATSPFRIAVRWWEPRRILYNVVLTAVFVTLAARTWSRLSPELTPLHVMQLGVLALIANLCYCTAYVVDLAAFSTSERATSDRWRWALWTVGTLFAAFVETYWFLDEILPPVR